MGSALHSTVDCTVTMASSDSSRQILFQPASANTLPPSVRPPRVRAQSFSPSTCRIYTNWFRVAIGLRLV